AGRRADYSGDSNKHTHSYTHTHTSTRTCTYTQTQRNTHKQEHKHTHTHTHPCTMAILWPPVRHPRGLRHRPSNRTLSHQALADYGSIRTPLWLGQQSHHRASAPHCCTN